MATLETPDLSDLGRFLVALGDPIRQAILATSPTNDRQAMTNAGLVWVGNGTGPGINAARWYQSGSNAYITVFYGS